MVDITRRAGWTRRDMPETTASAQVRPTVAHAPAHRPLGCGAGVDTGAVAGLAGFAVDIDRCERHRQRTEAGPDEPSRSAGSYTQRPSASTTPKHP